MKARHKRFGFLLVGLAGLGLAVWLLLNALDSNLSYFFSPTEVAQDKAPKDHVYRLGGLVEGGSLQRGQELTVRFVVTDNANKVNVEYTGILPDLFKEGQGVVVEGRINTADLQSDSSIQANLLMVKHSEVYDTQEDHSKMREARLLDDILKDEKKY